MKYLLQVLFSFLINIFFFSMFNLVNYYIELIGILLLIYRTCHTYICTIFSFQKILLVNKLQVKVINYCTFYYKLGILFHILDFEIKFEK